MQVSKIWFSSFRSDKIWSKLYQDFYPISKKANFDSLLLDWFVAFRSRRFTKFAQILIIDTGVNTTLLGYAGQEDPFSYQSITLSYKGAKHSHYNIAGMDLFTVSLNGLPFYQIRNGAYRPDQIGFLCYDFMPSKLQIKLEATSRKEMDSPPSLIEATYKLMKYQSELQSSSKGPLVILSDTFKEEFLFNGLVRNQSYVILSRYEMVLLALGIKTGTVIDLGATKSQISMIHNGKQVFQHELYFMNGFQIDNALFMKKLVSFSLQLEPDLAKYYTKLMKESFGSIAHKDQKVEVGQKARKENKEKLGSFINNLVRIQDSFVEKGINLTEFYFPEEKEKNIAHVIKRIFDGCKLDRPLKIEDFQSNIVFVGGNSSYEGFVERFREEFKELCQSNFNVQAPKDQKKLGFKGASLLLSSVQSIADEFPWQVGPPPGEGAIWLDQQEWWDYGQCDTQI